jgi:hypothetical protein
MSGPPPPPRNKKGQKANLDELDSNHSAVGAGMNVCANNIFIIET